MRFSTSRPGKTNKYFVTKPGRRDKVSKIYKLTKCVEDRLRNGASTWWWNITALWLSSSTFFRFLGQPTGRNFDPNCTLNGSKVVFRLIHAPLGGLVPSNLLWGGLRSEWTTAVDELNRPVSTSPVISACWRLIKIRASRIRTHDLWIRERVCYPLHHSASQYKHSSRKGQITKIQHDIHRHLKFPRCIYMCSSFELLSTNLVGILWPRLVTHLCHSNWIVTIQMASATI